VNHHCYYLGYGLLLQSEIPLTQAPTADKAAADVVIYLTNPDHAEPSAHDDGLRVSGAEACLSWKEIGTFLVRSGREIAVNPAPGVDESLLGLYASGPALAALLHQRGLLVLHASAVSIDGEAVAFLGGPGYGKSSMAAALHARGHALAADDVVAVSLSDVEHPMVYPGFPQLKLWPDTATTLGDPPESLSRLHPATDKRARPAPRGFSTAPLRLRRLYILAEGTHAQIEEVEPQAAFAELVRHTFTARLLNATCAPSHLRQCANLVSRVPIRRLSSQRSLAALPDLAALVEQDLAGKPH
jgi:hypothetical protein